MGREGGMKLKLMKGINIYNWRMNEWMIDWENENRGMLHGRTVWLVILYKYTYQLEDDWGDIDAKKLSL